MIGFKQHLHELLTNAYPYKKVGKYVFEFRDEKNNHYVVSAKLDHGRGEIFFVLETNGEINITSNAASPFKVFATVGQIMKEVDKPDWNISFNGDIREPSRVKLYERLAKAVAAARGGYVETRLVKNDETTYKHFTIYPNSDF